MKTVKKLLYVFIVLFLILQTGCSHYRSWDNFTKIEVDGVAYEACPNLKWRESPESHKKEIGTTGLFGNASVYAIEEDTYKNFIFIHVSGEDMWRKTLFRNDKTVPEPSGDIMEYFKFVGQEIKTGIIKPFEYVVEDKEIIQSLFELLENGEASSEGFNTHGANVYCYSDEMPGMYYQISILVKEDEYICGGWNEGTFTELPPEMLEKISGHRIEELAWSVY